MKKKLRRIIVVLGLGLLAVLAAGFAATRSAFITRFILPRVAKALGTPVAADKIQVLPLNRLLVRNLRVGPTEKPLFTAEGIDLRYSARALLAGNLRVDSLFLANATAQVLQDADGNWNLPALPPSNEADDAKADDAGAKDKLPEIDIRGISIKNLRILVRTAAGANNPEGTAEISNLNLVIDRIAPGQPLNLEISSDLGENGIPGKFIIGAGKLAASLRAELGNDMLPRTAALRVALRELRGGSKEFNLDGTELELLAGVKSTGPNRWLIEKLQLITSRGLDKPLIGLNVAGELGMAPATAALDITVDRIHPLILNLAGMLAGGFNFGKTRVAYEGRLVLAEGASLRSTGTLQVMEASIANPAKGLPETAIGDIKVVHDAGFSLKDKLLEIKRLDADILREMAEIVKIRLSAPLTIAMAPASQSAASAPAPASLDLRVNQLDLRLANPFLPASTAVDEGKLSLEMQVQASQDASRLTGNGRLTVDGLAMQAAGMRPRNLNLAAGLDFGLAGLRHLALDKIELRIANGPATALDAVLAGKLDLETLLGQFKLDIRELNQESLAFLPEEMRAAVGLTALKLSADIAADADLKAGTAKIKGTAQAPVAHFSATAPVPGAKITLDAGFDLAAGAKGLDIAACDLLAKDTAGAILAKLGITGKVPLPLDSGRINAAINLSQSDLMAVQKLLAGDPAAAKPQQTEDPSDKPDAEPPAVDLGKLAVSADLAFTNLSYGEILITDGSGKLDLTDSKITLDPLKFMLAGAPVSTSLKLDLNRPGYAYDLKAGVGKLDFQPFVGTFAPAFKGKVSGAMKALDLRAAGAGITVPNLKKHLDAGLLVELDRLVLENMEEIKAAALKFGTLELERIEVTAAKLEAGTRDGAIVIPETVVAGADFKAKVWGGLEFTGEPRDLRAELGLAGALAKKMDAAGFLRYLSLRDDKYHYLPVQIPFKGRFPMLMPAYTKENFIADMAKLMLSGPALKSAINDAAGSVIRGEKVDTRTLIGNILGGKNAATPAPPAPAPAPETAAPPAQPAPNTAAPAPETAPQPAAPEVQEKPKSSKELRREAGIKLLEGLLSK